MSDAVTQGIRVHVVARYVPAQSNPKRSEYFFAYSVTITNEGDRPAKLVTRHWIITDGFGRTEEVKGPGVVGHQPHLKPGQSFEYTSACPLRTPSGTMRGTYQMVRDNGETFDAEIAPFTLVDPSQVN